MDESINTGSENKLPLIISVVAVGAAFLALLFAFKAKNEANALKDKLADTETSLRTAVDKAGAGAAKSADLATVRDDFTQFKADVIAKFEEASRTIGAQNNVIRELVAGKKTAPTAGKADANGATKPAAEPAAGEYKIKAGDTLTKIAKANGTTAQAILAGNPGLNPAKLKVGQIIKLPAAKK